MDNAQKDNPMRLSPSDIQKAKEKTTLKLSTHDLRIARRQVQFFDRERISLKQQYLGKEVADRKVNSCTIASALIAMERIGEITVRVMADLERDLVEQAVQKGYFNSGANTGISATRDVFSAFGLQNGYARTIGEIEAALRSGGCATIAYDGHVRTISEESLDRKQFKALDPLQDYSSLMGRQFIEQKLQRGNGGVTSNVIVVYPKGYTPDASRGETFSRYSMSNPSFRIDPKYISRKN